MNTELKSDTLSADKSADHRPISRPISRPTVGGVNVIAVLKGKTSVVVFL